MGVVYLVDASVYLHAKALKVCVHCWCLLIHVSACAERHGGVISILTVRDAESLALRRWASTIQVQVLIVFRGGDILGWTQLFWGGDRGWTAEFRPAQQEFWGLAQRKKIRQK